MKFNSYLLLAAVLSALVTTSQNAVRAQPPEAAPKAPELKIVPTFVDLGEMTFAGIAAYAGPASPRFPELWMGGFMDVMPDVKDDSADYGLETSKYAYGLELFGPNFEKDPKRNFTYMACSAVTDSRKVPMHLLQRTVPAARYAAFKVPGGVKGLGAAFGYIYTRWLPQSEYRRAYPFDIERYDIPAGIANGDGPVVEILVPVALRKQ